MEKTNNKYIHIHNTHKEDTIVRFSKVQIQINDSNVQLN